MSFLNTTDIKQVLSDKKTLGLNLFFVFMMVYIVSSGGDHRSIKLFLIGACLLLSTFYVKKISQPLLWYLFLIILINDLILDYFVRANHHFFLIYLTALIIIYLHTLKMELLITNIKLVVVIVLVFSAIQKMISPQFTSGDYYYYMINIGSFFKPVLYFFPEMDDILYSNKEQLLDLAKTDPNNFKTITLANVLPQQAIFSRVFAWMTIIMELLAAVLLLWKPKHNITHIVFILMIAGVFFTRLETGFIALLAISGVWMSTNLKLRAVYTVLSLIALALVITKIGFY